MTLCFCWGVRCVLCVWNTATSREIKASLDCGASSGICLRVSHFLYACSSSASLFPVLKDWLRIIHCSDSGTITSYARALRAASLAVGASGGLASE